MAPSTLDDAFGHHVWATLRVIDACQPLGPEQLAAAVPGTFGSIMDTLRHLVGGDASYLSVMPGAQPRQIDEDALDVQALRSVMVGHGSAWAAVLATDPDPEQAVVRRRDDGSESSAPMSIRLAQALHHGTDHRSQICTALTTLGIEPPEIDVWDFAWAEGRLSETKPAQTAPSGDAPSDDAPG